MHVRKEILTNLLWRFLGSSGTQAVTVLVGIVLARLLEPAVYGTAALVMVFISILQVFVDSGLGTALIQRLKADDTDFSTVFFFNLGVCVLLWLFLFFLSPYIAGFYGKYELVKVLRVMGLSLIVSGLTNVQLAYVSRNLMFRRHFIASMAGVISGAAAGIFSALHSPSVWALVWQYLVTNIVLAAVLWQLVRWRPVRRFSGESLRRLLSFGWKLLVSALLDTGYTQLRGLIIGKLYPAKELAFYNKGAEWPALIVTSIDTAINSVLLPAMSREQENSKRVRAMTRRAISVSCCAMCPIMVFLAAAAEPLIRLLLTDKWLVSVPFLRIFCFTYAFYPIHTANLNAINALGRSDLFLKLEIMKKIVGITSVLVTMRISVLAMAYSLIVTSVLSQLINSWPNKKLLGYSYWQQLTDIMPVLVISCVSGFAGWCINLAALTDFVKLGLIFVVVFGLYAVLSRLFSVEPFVYITETIGLVKKNRRTTVGSKTI